MAGLGGNLASYPLMSYHTLKCRLMTAGAPTCERERKATEWAE